MEKFQNETGNNTQVYPFTINQFLYLKAYQFKKYQNVNTLLDNLLWKVKETVLNVLRQVK